MAINDTIYFFNVFNGFSLVEARAVIEPLIIFIVGMVVYCVFIFKLYKVISRKNIFKLDIGKYQKHPVWSRVKYALEYLLLFPIVTFVWFLVMSIILATMSDVLTIRNIFVISIAIIATIRIAAYYDQELSVEIAKLLPLSLLAIFIVNIGSVSFEKSSLVIDQLFAASKTLYYYFGFLVILEFLLRLMTAFRKEQPKKKGEI